MNIRPQTIPSLRDFPLATRISESWSLKPWIWTKISLAVMARMDGARCALLGPPRKESRDNFGYQVLCWDMPEARFMQGLRCDAVDTRGSHEQHRVCRDSAGNAKIMACYIHVFLVCYVSELCQIYVWRTQRWAPQRQEGQTRTAAIEPVWSRCLQPRPNTLDVRRPTRTQSAARARRQRNHPRLRTPDLREAGATHG